MAVSALQARRDARKRRILENSENRLQKIFGKQDSLLPENDEVRHQDFVSDVDLPKENGNVQTHLENVPRSRPVRIIHHEDIHLHDIAEPLHGDEILLNEEEGSSISLDQLLGKKSSDIDECAEKLNGIPFFQIILSKRIHVIVLAVIVRLLLAFDHGFLFGENLLLPFFLIELTEILTSDQEPSGSSGALGAALLLSGIIPQKVAFITKISNRITTLMQNFCLYIFTFIIFYAIVEWPG